MTAKRKPRPVINPLQAIAGKQLIGKDADRIMFPVWVHLQEYSTGHGHAASIRQLTCFVAAADDLADILGLSSLKHIAETAADALRRAADRARERGDHQRLVPDGPGLVAIRGLVGAIDDLLPRVQLASWVGPMTHALNVWDSRRAALSLAA